MALYQFSYNFFTHRSPTGCHPPIEVLYGFIKAHGSRFDDHVVRSVCNAANGLPPGGSSSKVRNGRVGDHVDRLSPDVRQALDRIWREEMEGRFGFASYRDMLAALGPAGDSPAVA